MSKDVDLNEIEKIISHYLISKDYRQKIDGNNYYLGNHDILKRKRTAIGERGEIVEVSNLVNNKLIDNQYRKLVKQKVNYLLGKHFVVTSENEEYTKLLDNTFNDTFMKTIKRVSIDTYNNGIGWIYVYIDDNNRLCFKKLPSIEVIPVWKDNEHDLLDYAIRIYEIKKFEKSNYIVEQFVEVYKTDGIYYYKLNGSRLDYIDYKAYITRNDEAYTWGKIPLIAFRSDETESSLLKRVKTLQDALNELISDFTNNMQEDARNTILVLNNYDGTDLGEFRNNLTLYGVVKVSDGGDVKTLSVEVNSNNYESIVKLLKKSIIENGAGFDAKSDIMGNSPNQLNIRSMYSDIDLDSNDIETEYKSSLQQLIELVNYYITATQGKDYSNEKVDIIFNKDILINESQTIEDIQKSVGILSRETLVEQHPWVENVELELQRLENEEDTVEEYGGLTEHEHVHDLNE